MKKAMPRKKRKSIAAEDEEFVLVQSLRRCCLCVFLDGKDEAVRGQIAHVDRNRENNARSNLVFLCLNHHDDYDTPHSQSKSLTAREVKAYRERLYGRHGNSSQLSTPEFKAINIAELVAELEAPREINPAHLDEPWRFPLWQISGRLELFPYKVVGRADGVCLIERIHLPDGRIVVCCVSAPGNPGQSVTNAVEEIVYQVSRRFGIPPQKLVWIEHYPEYGIWHQVLFDTFSTDGLLGGPKWMPMTQQLWNSLGLNPIGPLHTEGNEYPSLLTKSFDWLEGEAMGSKGVLD